MDATIRAKLAPWTVPPAEGAGGQNDQGLMHKKPSTGEGRKARSSIFVLDKEIMSSVWANQ